MTVVGVCSKGETMKVNIQKKKPFHKTKVADAKIGTIGNLYSEERLLGKFVLVAYNGFIDLESPHRTWSHPLDKDFTIVPLPKGTIIELTVG